MSNDSLPSFHKHKVNRVIYRLIYTDLLLNLALGLVTPMIAVFYVNNLRGGTIAMVGLVTAVYWIVKSGVQVPVSLYADNHKGERDDYVLMILGYLIVAIVPLLYAFWVKDIWQVFLVETIHGIGFGMATPPFLSIFTRHIDGQKENFEWMLYSNAVGLSYAVAAAIGGIVVEHFGFRLIFLFVSAMSLLSPINLLFIRKQMRRTDCLDGIDPEIEIKHENLPPHDT